MPLSRDSRAERKLKALLRATFRLKQNWERIDHEEDYIGPIIEAMKSGKPVMGLPAEAALAFEVVVDDEVSHPGVSTESGRVADDSSLTDSDSDTPAAGS